MIQKRQEYIAEPLQRRHMPTDFSISLKNYTDNFTVRIPKDFGPSQSLVGFEETYRNIIDYIVRITYRIWEEREVDKLAENWIFIDMLHFLNMQGLDVLERNCDFHRT
jgi:hypothetical protein